MKFFLLRIRSSSWGMTNYYTYTYIYFFEKIYLWQNVMLSNQKHYRRHDSVDNPLAEGHDFSEGEEGQGVDRRIVRDVGVGRHPGKYEGRREEVYEGGIEPMGHPSPRLAA